VRVRNLVVAQDVGFAVHPLYVEGQMQGGANHSSRHEDRVEVPRSAPSLRALWRNIAQPGSARWKAERWSVNMLRRLRTRSTCCGRPGEPGC
jgi:hypothetical protein